jgi:uncharacterized protein YjbJ (UPF0337 family)
MDHNKDTRDGFIDKTKGRAKEAAGTVKQKVGEAIGNEEMESEGLAQRGEGKFDRAKGAVKDTVHDAKETVRAGAEAVKQKIGSKDRNRDR